MTIYNLTISMRKPGMSRQIGAKSFINTQIVKLTSFLQKAFPLALPTNSRHIGINRDKLCVGAMLFFLCLPASAEDALLTRDTIGTSMVRPGDRTSLKAGGDAHDNPRKNRDASIGMYHLRTRTDPRPSTASAPLHLPQMPHLPH